MTLHDEGPTGLKGSSLLVLKPPLPRNRSIDKDMFLLIIHQLPLLAGHVGAPTPALPRKGDQRSMGKMLQYTIDKLHMTREREDKQKVGMKRQLV